MLNGGLLPLGANHETHTGRDPLAPVTTAGGKRPRAARVTNMCRKEGLGHGWWERKRLSKRRRETDRPHAAISRLDLCPQQVTSASQRDTCTSLSTAASLTTAGAEPRKPPRRLSADEWVRKHHSHTHSHTHTHTLTLTHSGYSSAFTKKDPFLWGQHGVTWRTSCQGKQPRHRKTKTADLTYLRDRKLSGKQHSDSCQRLGRGQGRSGWSRGANSQ